LPAAENAWADASCRHCGGAGGRSADIQPLFIPWLLAGVPSALLVYSRTRPQTDGAMAAEGNGRLRYKTWTLLAEGLRSFWQAGSLHALLRLTFRSPANISLAIALYALPPHYISRLYLGVALLPLLCLCTCAYHLFINLFCRCWVWRPLTWHEERRGGKHFAMVLMVNMFPSVQDIATVSLEMSLLYTVHGWLRGL